MVGHYGTVECLIYPLEFCRAMWLGREYPLEWELQSNVMFLKKLICYGQVTKFGCNWLVPIH